MDGHSTRDRSGYVPELDTFRLVAILSVMCLHWLNPEGLLDRLQGQLCNGVHLFFVLSGYLITGILLRCRLNIERQTATLGYSLRQFYVRRFLRIFPVYYFVLGIGVLFDFEGLRRGIFWHASYTSNFYYYFKKGFDGPASLFWTLAVEEQFYLIWPLAILTLPKKYIFPFVSAIALLGAACRIQALLTDSWSRILTPQCMIFLAVGSLLAVAESPFCGSPKMRSRLLRVSVAIIAALFFASAVCVAAMGPHRAMSSRLVRAINQPMISLVFACIIAWVVQGTPGSLMRRALRWSPFVYLGRVSYGLYVYQLFITFALRRGEPWLAAHLARHTAYLLTDTFAVRFTVCVAVASASWFLLEKPINDLKRFFPYARARNDVVLAQ